MTGIHTSLRDITVPNSSKAIIHNVVSASLASSVLSTQLSEKISTSLV